MNALRLTVIAVSLLFSAGIINVFAGEGAMCGSASGSAAAPVGQTAADEPGDEGSEAVESDSALEPASKSAPIDLDDGSDSYAGVDRGRLMQSWESYDENTGLPNIVPSDQEGEIE